MNMPLKKPEGLSWNAASVELPEIPMLPAGQDALSATISAVLPTLAAPLAANVATLQAKENMFSGKLGAAQAAYQNSDDAGSQSVGQIVGMLGQVGQQAGQMGQMAGAPAQAIGGQTGMFGSLMQQAMQAAQGGGAGSQSGGQRCRLAHRVSPAQVAAPVRLAPPVRQQQPRDEAVGAKEDQPNQHARGPARQSANRCTAPRQMTAPWPDRPTTAGTARPAPVKSPEHPRRGEDLGRRM